MKKQILSFFLVISLFSLLPAIVHAQDSTLVHLKHLITSLTRHKEVLPGEQIYLQTDKPYYAIGDTLWLKAYVLNPDLVYSNKSGVIYLEFLNDSSRLVKRLMLPVKYGLGWGCIALNKEEFNQGSYTLRCYTNWQRNFSEERFYTISITIGSSESNLWLVNAVVGKDKQQVKSQLQFKKLDQLPLSLQDLQVKVYHGRHELYNQKMTTSIEGLLNVNFAVDDKTNGGLSIKAEAIKTNVRQNVTIPLHFTQPNDIDLQFMPEGGNLVVGLKTRVAFKALDPDGLSAEIKGKITDSKQHEVLQFRSAHKGMGVFNLAPINGETYTATLTLTDGTVKTYSLPVVQQSGTVLNVANKLESDSLELDINSTPDKAGKNYMLIAQSREVVCYAAKLYLNNGKMVKTIAKDVFPTGITRFTLLDEFGHPLNERLVFIDHHDKLQVTLNTDKQAYHPGDSIAIRLKVASINGAPQQSFLSMAVTDDAQLKTQSTQENILTTMLLNNGIKGNIEEPGYYLNTNTEAAWQSLDNLLLAQGWTAYNWKEIDAGNFTPAFAPEKEFAVKGKVTNVFGKPVKGGNVVLLSSKPPMVKDTVTDDKGNFRFSNLPLSDTLAYNLQSRNRKGNSFNVGITIDEFKAPRTPVYNNTLLPWYVNTDSTLTNYIRSVNRHQQFDDLNIPRGTNVLKEVHITAKKVIKDSKNLNGPGKSDFALDHKDLEKAGDKNLLDLFQEKLPGFHMVAKWGRRWYYIHDEPLFLVVDGVALHKMIIPLTYDDFRSWLLSTSAEDVKGVEEIYNNSFSYELEYLGQVPTFPIAFVEITTRSGKGPSISRTPGTFLYKPMPLVSFKDFYKPKYITKNAAALALDSRSTIHWEPNIVTDAKGEANISFYAAGKPGTYTFVVEGSDLNGNIGYNTGKIIIK